MHIDTSTANLWKEVQNAEAANKERLGSFSRQMKTYVGPYFARTQFTTADPDPQYDPANFGFQFTAWMLPQLVYNNPKWSVRSNKTGPTELIAKAHKHALDRWSRDEGLSQKLQMPAVDFLHNWTVMLVTLEDHPTIKQQTGKHKGKPSRRVRIDRIPQDRSFRDPQATSEEEVAFRGHSWLTTKADLRQRAEDFPEEGWSLDAIESLSEGENVSEQNENRISKQWDVDRKQVVIYEMWLKGHEEDDHPGPEEGFHGTIFTLSLTQMGDTDPSPGELRKPRPFYGPPCGPYHIGDVYPVSNEPFRLAPLLAVEGQVREWNSLTRAINRSAAKYKRLILVNTQHEDLGELIAGGEHDLVIPVPGLEKDQLVVNLEVGGITQEMLVTEQRAKELVERASGYTEAAQGQVSGNSTATEAGLVQKNSDTRTGFIKLRFSQFVSGLGYAASWYFWHEEELQFALGEEAAKDFDVPEGAELWFEGGDHDPEKGRTHADLDMDIEPRSMAQMTEAEVSQRAITRLDLVERLSTMAAAMPWADVKRLAAQTGADLGFSGLEDMIDVDVAAVLGMQGALQASPHQEQPKLQVGSSASPPTGWQNNGPSTPPNPKANQMMKPPTPQPQAQPQGA